MTAPHKLPVCPGRHLYVIYPDINGLAQDSCNSSALALELPQPCTKPSIWGFVYNKQIFRACIGNYFTHYSMGGYLLFMPLVMLLSDKFSETRHTVSLSKWWLAICDTVWMTCSVAVNRLAYYSPWKILSTPYTAQSANLPGNFATNTVDSDWVISIAVRRWLQMPWP